MMAELAQLVRARKTMFKTLVRYSRLTTMQWYGLLQYLWDRDSEVIGSNPVLRPTKLFMPELTQLVE